MATITATYLDDLGRVRLELVDGGPGVRYRVQRSTAADATWVDVRGGQFLSTTFTTIIDDYEYTPNIVNTYRLIEPVFYDAFDRAYPSAGTLSLTGASNSYASTPDTASLDLTGDLDMRVDATMTWGGMQQTLMGKYVTTGNQRSYRFTVETSGRLRLTRSPDGTATTGVTSTVAVPVTSGRLAVRVTLDADNGAGGHTVTFYTAANGVGGPWVQLGTPVVTAGTITNFSGTAPLEVGASNNGALLPLTGQVHAAQLRSSIAGAIVANPDFAAQAAGTTNFVDSAGRTWTVQPGASIITIAPVPGTNWGTANTGQTWALGGSSTGFAAYVNNGVGVITSSAPVGFVMEQVTSQIAGAEDAEVTWSAIYPGAASLLDASVEWFIGLRAADANNAYTARIRFDTVANDSAVTLQINKFVANVQTDLGALTTVGDWIPGVPWHVRFRVQGSTLSARAWQEGADEPANWNVVVVDTSLVAGTAVYVQGAKASGTAYEQWFGPIEVHSIPDSIADTVTVTPFQDGVFLKSLTYPMLNRELDCVDWQELSRSSRTAFFDIKGRHEILGIADVGSSASFSLTFISRSKAENRAIVALLTYGGVMLLQPPGDDDEDEECPTLFSGIPEGYVMVGDSVQSRTVYGKPIWQWTVEFTRVAASDASNIVPTTITWTQLWDLIGPEGTWEDVWATWSTWQELWLTSGNPLALGGTIVG
jgi:hypothetical protein